MRTIALEDKAIIRIPASNSRIRNDVQYRTLTIASIKTLADEEAINSMWYAKGASGISPCPLCHVTNKQRPEDRKRGLRRLTDIDPRIKDISCADVQACKLRSDDEIWRCCQKLQDSPAGKPLEEAEHAHGFKFGEESLLWDVELRPFCSPNKSIVTDPQHVLFSNGLLAAEIMLFMDIIKRPPAEATWSDLISHHLDGKWQGKKLLMTEELAKHCGEFLKLGSSDLLSQYPAVRCFVHAIYGDAPEEPHVVSLLALMKVCDLCYDMMSMDSSTAWGKLQLQETATQFKEAASTYVDKFVSAYGRDAVRFKHHQLLHIADQVFENRMMLSCFVTERHHIMTKYIVEKYKGKGNVCHSPESCLSEALFEMLHKLEEEPWVNKLGKEVRWTALEEEWGGTLKVFLSKQIRFRSVKYSAGHVLRINARAPAVAHAVIEALGFLRVEELESHALLNRGESPSCTFAVVCKKFSHVRDTAFSSVWSRDGTCELIYLYDDAPIRRPRYSRWLSADQIECMY